MKKTYLSPAMETAELLYISTLMESNEDLYSGPGDLDPFNNNPPAPERKPF